MYLFHFVNSLFQDEPLYSEIKSLINNIEISFEELTMLEEIQGIEFHTYEFFNHELYEILENFNENKNIVILFQHSSNFGDLFPTLTYFRWGKRIEVSLSYICFQNAIILGLMCNGKGSEILADKSFSLNFYKNLINIYDQNQGKIITTLTGKNLPYSSVINFFDFLNDSLKIENLNSELEKNHLKLYSNIKKEKIEKIMPTFSILLIGKTRSGKTSLINLLKGKDITSIKFESDTKIVNNNPIWINKVKYNFIDTPGFNDVRFDDSVSLKNSEVMNMISKKTKISSIFCCLSATEVIEEITILSICELLHLYNVGTSNIIFVFTKCDPIFSNSKKLKEIEQRILERLGLMKFAYFGNHPQLIQDFKEMLPNICHLPLMDPVPNYVSTSQIIEEIIYWEKELNEKLLKLTTNIALKDKLISLNDEILKLESKKGFFSFGDSEPLKLLKKERKDLHEKVTCGKFDISKEIEEYKENINIIKKEKLIRLSKFRNIMGTFHSQYNQEIAEKEIKSHNSELNLAIQRIKILKKEK